MPPEIYVVSPSVPTKVQKNLHEHNTVYADFSLFYIYFFFYKVMTYPFAPVMYIVPFMFEDGESSSMEKRG